MLNKIFIISFIFIIYLSGGCNNLKNNLFSPLPTLVSHSTPTISLIEEKYNKAMNLSKEGKYNESIKILNELLNLQPKNAFFWNEKGNCFYNKKKYKEAISCYNKALHINPKFSVFWCNKGNSLIFLKKYKEALVCYDKVLMFDKNNKIAKNFKKETLKILKRNKISSINFIINPGRSLKGGNINIIINSTTKDDLLKFFGEPDKKECIWSGSAERWHYYYLNLIFEFDIKETKNITIEEELASKILPIWLPPSKGKNKVWRIFIQNPKYKTPEGFGVGSNVVDVETIYPTYATPDYVRSKGNDINFLLCNGDGISFEYKNQINCIFIYEKEDITRNIKQELIDIKTNFTENERIEIFKELVYKEDSAYGNFNLIEQYRHDTASEYGITYDQLLDIASEGLQKNWLIYCNNTSTF